MSEEVRHMFAAIANHYDRINNILSFGMHHRWRRRTVQVSGTREGDIVLDCATGTGDLAIEFKKKVGESGTVLGTDFCAEMVKQAPAKTRRHGLTARFAIADTLHLPYEANRFDIAGIAFGIRNVDSPLQALREMARVVKGGGKVVVLEFAQPRGLMKLPYYLYSHCVIPAVGGWLSGNRAAYVYLLKTSARFPAGYKFLELMEKTGAFSDQKSYLLAGGIACIYVGTVH